MGCLLNVVPPKLPDHLKQLDQFHITETKLPDQLKLLHQFYIVRMNQIEFDWCLSLRRLTIRQKLEYVVLFTALLDRSGRPKSYGISKLGISSKFRQSVLFRTAQFCFLKIGRLKC